MNFLKQAEECGEKIDHLALLHPSPSLDFGKVTLSSNHFEIKMFQALIWIVTFPAHGALGSDQQLGCRAPPCHSGKPTLVQILNISHFGWFIVGCKILNMTLIGCKIRVGTSFWIGDTSNNGLLWAAQNWYWGETLLALSFLLETLRQLFKQAYLAIHSFGNLVIHPSSYYSHLVRKLYI